MKQLLIILLLMISINGYSQTKPAAKPKIFNAKSDTTKIVVFEANSRFKYLSYKIYNQIITNYIIIYPDNSFKTQSVSKYFDLDYKKEYTIPKRVILGTLKELEITELKSNDKK